MPDPTRGRTVRDPARYYRVSEDKIRRWIASGELRAVNTAGRAGGKPRWVIPPDAQDEFERRRTTPGPTPKTTTRRRPVGAVDFFPD